MSTEKILSSDGIPLELSLKKAERKNKLKAVMLVAPLFLFLIITYVFPIGDMLFRSVDDRMITSKLPNTFAALEQWDGKDLPDEEVYEAFYKDFYPLAMAKESGKLYQRLNYEKSGFSSGLKKTNRTINAMPPYVGWGQEVTFTTVARGGHVHLITEPDEYAQAAAWVKPTWLAGFPLAWQRVMDIGNNGGHAIGVFEYSGAKLVDGQKERFEEFFGHRNWICGYGDAATGMTFVNYSSNFDHIGKPIQCLIDTGGEFRIGSTGTIEFRGLHTPNQDWWDTGDLVKIDADGNWQLLGRANELIIIRGGGKVYPFEVEAMISKHPLVQEVFVYPQPDNDLHFVPACVYYGDVDPRIYSNWVEPLMVKWKQPVRYIQLAAPTSKLQQQANVSKISRLKLHTLVSENKDWIKDEYIK